jgi:DNA invertase Pin-like site-specific DNA recombinase
MDLNSRPCIKSPDAARQSAVPEEASMATRSRNELGPILQPTSVSEATQSACYLRVSTDTQSTDNQRPELVQMATGRGWSVARWYVDEAVSGRAAVCPAFDEMMADAKRGRFRVLLIWSLDRFGRNMHRTIGDVLELDRLGVQVVSAKEAWLDQQGPARSLLLAVLSWVAEQEAVRLSERVKAGLQRARLQGRIGGRPRVLGSLIDSALARVARGESVTAAARRAGIHAATLRRYRALGAQ